MESVAKGSGGSEGNPFSKHEDVVDYVTRLNGQDENQTRNHVFYVTCALQRSYLNSGSLRDWIKEQYLTVCWGRRLAQQRIIYNYWDSDCEEYEDCLDPSQM